MKKELIKKIGNIFQLGTNGALGNKETKQYWTDHNVTLHHQFQSALESIEYFNWRNAQYYNYINLMPVTGQTGNTVLDFGCGPGHDLVGFSVYSKPHRLVGADLSQASLDEAAYRLGLHQAQVDFIQISASHTKLPFEDATFDYIHSSGVLHHTPNPVAILSEFNRILKPEGAIRIMVYNYESVWLHLYVAYQRAILQNLHGSQDIREQFQKSTDGENCPISNCYRPMEWIALCREAGFKADLLGNAISMHEMSLLSHRFSAIQDIRLRSESRDFLLSLKFDEYGYPKFQGHYAGVDACYLLTKATDDS